MWFQFRKRVRQLGRRLYRGTPSGSCIADGWRIYGKPDGGPYPTMLKLPLDSSPRGPTAFSGCFKDATRKGKGPQGAVTSASRIQTSNGSFGLPRSKS